MPREITPKDDIPELTDEQVLQYGNAIVPTSMIPVVWQGITKRKYDRSAPLHARKDGKIVPMGRNRNRLYFWTHEVKEAVPSTTMGAPPGSNPGKMRKQRQ